MDSRLLDLAFQEAPRLIEGLRELFNRTHPSEPTPTSEEVIAAYTSALRSSIAVDDAILAAHPEADSEGESTEGEEVVDGDGADAEADTSTPKKKKKKGH